MSETSDLRQRLTEAGKTGAAQLAPMPVREANTFRLTAGELRDACENCTSHPHATVFLNAVKDFPDSKDVIIERQDLEAMLDGKLCRMETAVRKTESGSEMVQRKTLVPMPGKPAPTSRPAPKKSQDED